MKKVNSYAISEYDEWSFIEEFLPDYHRRDDVLYNDIVTRYVDGEDLDESDLEMMKETFPNVKDAEKWLDDDIRRLFLEAVANAYDEGAIEDIITSR